MSRPSAATDKSLSLVFTVIVSYAGTTSGRTFSVCGQIGTMTKASKSGYNTGPPADSPYAVEPVGVEMISPSAI